MCHAKCFDIVEADVQRPYITQRIGSEGVFQKLDAEHRESILRDVEIREANIVPHALA